MSTPPTPPAANAPPRGDDGLAPQDVVLRFLQSVGTPSEARFYLDLFRANPPEQFAAIAVDGNVLHDALDAVVQDLRFLASLDLFPTIVLGIFQPADAAADGKRLARRLVAGGVQAVLLPTSSSGLADLIRRAVQDDVVPIVTFEPGEPGSASGGAPGSGPASGPAGGAAGRLEDLGRILGDLAARKLIFLHRPGGLRQRGTLVPIVNLSEDVPRLLASRELSRKETLILEHSRRLVGELSSQRLVVAVTSPLSLLRELFTVRGAGTLLRRGALVVRHDGWNGVDRERVSELLASSFGRAADSSFFERDVAHVYLESEHRGVAILLATPLGMYLTKFAVSREAQGEGIAREMWDALVADHPVLFWRARAANPIVDWYGKLCDGLVRAGDWHVFWKGLARERIPDAIDWALAQPVDIPASE